MDDNAQPHRILAVEELLESEDITRMDWPAYSPDLNPNEHVWDALGRRIAAHLNHPENTQQLKQMVIEEWALLPQEMLHQLDLTPKRIILLFQYDGAPSRESKGVPIGDISASNHMILFTWEGYWKNSTSYESLPLRVLAPSKQLWSTRGRAVVPTRRRNMSHSSRHNRFIERHVFGDRLISRFGPVNWPPRSCDLTPLDYFLWGYVKSLVYVDKPQTLDHLEDNIGRVIADIRPQMLEKVIENWTSRLDYIRASRGSPMPEIIFKMTATAGSDVVQSGRPIFDDFSQHLWPYIGNNTANVVFQMVKRLWLIRIDQ
ncbi:transposable element Tcb2 transposase [Trichonephila clavipes]|nr:transposable element Tcb2 transposase [Trichonephila clavipes]